MKVFAATDDFTALVAALRARRMQLGLSQTDVDHLAGLPGGYQAKVELSLTNPDAKNARGLGRDSLPKILPALGLRLVVIAEAEFQAEKFKGRGLMVKLKGENAELSQPLRPNRILAERGRQGGLKRWAVMTPEQRQAFLEAAAAGRRASRLAIEQLSASAPPPTPIRPPSPAHPRAPIKAAPRGRLARVAIKSEATRKRDAARKRRQNVIERQSAARQSQTP